MRLGCPCTLACIEEVDAVQSFSDSQSLSDILEGQRGMLHFKLFGADENMPKLNRELVEQQSMLAPKIHHEFTLSRWICTSSNGGKKGL